MRDTVKSFAEVHEQNVVELPILHAAVKLFIVVINVIIGGSVISEAVLIIREHSVQSRGNTVPDDGSD